jgi:DNA helicase-2/ATP-dependent DNA helicase PcrA
MTMHAAKGLEFPVVFVVGVEEGIFPGIRAIGEAEEMEEERRLCYVAMTRAKEKLYMTCAAQRMLFGKTSANRPSRFVGEIPPELMEQSGRSPLAPSTEEDEPWGYRQSVPTRGNSGVVQAGGYGTSPRRERPARPRGIQGGYTPRPAAAGVALPDFHKGDMLTHKAFGTGMVLSIQPMGGDALIEIAFDKVGTKKLMLKSASQHMTKL